MYIIKKLIYIFIIIIFFQVKIYTDGFKKSNLTWKDLDWRFNEFRNNKSFNPSKLKIVCRFGYYYYSYQVNYDFYLALPYLDNNENMKLCYEED